jgi:hypothetical protein
MPLLAMLRDYGDDLQLPAACMSRDPLYAAVVTAQDAAVARHDTGKLLVDSGERYGQFYDRFRRCPVGAPRDPVAEALGNR